MVFSKVSVIEIREVLRSWLAGAAVWKVAAQAGWTARPPAGMLRRRVWPGMVGRGSLPMN